MNFIAKIHQCYNCSRNKATLRSDLTQAAEYNGMESSGIYRCFPYAGYSSSG
ncbi:MAG: hypothetical protein IJ736_13390 [Firmicutes bacterium]|nr:hypothetical protein [Bacillota bacterium]